MKTSLFVLCSVSVLSLSALADVRLPAVISNHMILQKGEATPVWGWADPGEEVTVTVAGQSAATKGDKDGKWRVNLNLSGVGVGPFSMEVRGKNSTTIEDVVVGEVWLASGQSNMAWLLKDTLDAEKEIPNSANPMIRQFVVARTPSPEPLEDTKGGWVIAMPQTTPTFTAVGYYFANKLNAELGVPVGLLHSSWGGTPVEAWTSLEGLNSDKTLGDSAAVKRQAQREHPAIRKAFVDGLTAWVETHNRRDPGAKDVAAFADPGVSTADWTKVKVPGPVVGDGLPGAGVVWIRKEIEASGGKSLPLLLPLDGFDQVYWNGQLLAATPFEKLPYAGFNRKSDAYTVKTAQVLHGKNTLAIRLYQPAKAAVFTGKPTAGNISLDGEWMAKAETSFPELKDAAPAPTPPPTPVLSTTHTAAYLFDGMIRPLIPYGLRGVIWYQGESNAGRADQYETAFKILISDWRKQWGNEDLSFYFCQLANFKAKTETPGESAWAELRETQTRALALPRTGQAVLIDLGESEDIHPRNKKDVGERLARIALAKDYGKDIPFSGPTLSSSTFENGRAVLTFSNTDGGLVAAPIPEKEMLVSKTWKTAPLRRNRPQSQLEGFAICGADKVWVWADAKIEGDKVIVQSDQVSKPVAVRYAWSDNPTCNLANGAGLPAGPFRTDDFPRITLVETY